MKKESLIKAILMLGGGFLVFYLLKPKPKSITSSSSSDKKTTSFVGDADMKNAEIVASAYTDALKAGESPSRLTELNKELMKDFGMRCYVGASGELVVSDTKGTTILTK